MATSYQEMTALWPGLSQHKFQNANAELNGVAVSKAHVLETLVRCKVRELAEALQLPAVSKKQVVPFQRAVRVTNDLDVAVVSRERQAL